MSNTHRRLLGAIVLVGAALRFATLGVQSYWLDEAATVDLVRRGFGAMLSGVAHGESTPPLYYVLAWVWAKLFGTSEVGLRSLSALLGTLTIPVAYALGRRVASERVGLVAAALTAFNPLLVWYSQEARSYALMVLLTGLGLLAFVNALERPAQRTLVAWAVASIAAMATHYYAAFLVGAQAVWLLRASRRRGTIVAVASVTAAGLALLPLALHQRSHGGAAFIGQTSLVKRIAQIPKQFVVGYHGPLEIALTIVALALVVFAFWRLGTGAYRGRPRLVVVAAVALAAIAAAIVLALAGSDYVIARNELATWLPLAVVTAAGFALPGPRGRVGIVAAAALCAVGVVAIIATAADSQYQRDDWRGAARALGPATGPRVVLVSPASGTQPLRLYLRGTRFLPPRGTPAAEIDLVSIAPRLPGTTPHPSRPSTVPLPPFSEYKRVQAPTYTVVKERARAPIQVVWGAGGPSPLDHRPAVALYQP